MYIQNRREKKEFNLNIYLNRIQWNFFLTHHKLFQISQFWSKLGQSNEQNKLQFMALAKGIGLEISAEELQAALGLTDELTDDQFESVAGGRDLSSSK